MAEWVARTPWVDFLAKDPATRSCTSICLAIVDAPFEALDAPTRADVVKKLVGLLEKEGVAYDIASYRDAPPGLRLWGGATVERDDLEAAAALVGLGVERSAAEVKAADTRDVGSEVSTAAVTQTERSVRWKR